MANPTVMEVADWSKRWDDKQIGFHMSDVNNILVKNFEQVKGSTVFVPLCGKTLDMLWLAQQGCTVIGVEAVEKAIGEFFTENNIPHSVQTLNGGVKCYKSDDNKITIFQCDLFASTPELFGTQFDLIWDRGSFVAINVDLRQRYVTLISGLMSPAAKWLLVTVDYDETKYGGPPHSVSDGDMRKYFGAHFTVTQVHSDTTAYEPRMKAWNLDSMTENAFIIAK